MKLTLPRFWECWVTKMLMDRGYPKDFIGEHFAIFIRMITRQQQEDLSSLHSIKVFQHNNSSFTQCPAAKGFLTQQLKHPELVTSKENL